MSALAILNVAEVEQQYLTEHDLYQRCLRRYLTRLSDISRYMGTEDDRLISVVIFELRETSYFLRSVFVCASILDALRAISSAFLTIDISCFDQSELSDLKEFVGKFITEGDVL